ncbi:MAG: glycosyltransferase family 2 protein [Candidatus Zixiibacteriota bacterium]
MYRDHFVTAIIPALNEQESIGLVLADLPDVIDEVIVCDNRSSDQTASVARAAGARVVLEPMRGYGAACLKAAEAVSDNTDALLFLDADYSDYPAEALALLDPIVSGEADFVIGSRALGAESRLALPPAARFGNRLATALIRVIWRVRFTDLGPFRAIRYASYRALRMRDRNFGWTIEMQIRAAKLGLRITERPVSYRKRIGKSKISGTIMGSVKAGGKILYLMLREALASGIHRAPDGGSQRFRPERNRPGGSRTERSR